MGETFEELKATMELYPNKLNKYIHQAARDKIIKMGRLNEVKGIDKKIDKVKETKRSGDDSIAYKARFDALKRKTVIQLREIAKNRGLKGYSSLKEDDLIKLILK